MADADENAASNSARSGASSESASEETSKRLPAEPGDSVPASQDAGEDSSAEDAPVEGSFAEEAAAEEAFAEDVSGAQDFSDLKQALEVLPGGGPAPPQSETAGYARWLRGRRDRALLLLGFATALRPRELISTQKKGVMPTISAGAPLDTSSISWSTSNRSARKALPNRRDDLGGLLRRELRKGRV